MFQNKQMLMYGNQLKYFENLKKELESRALINIFLKCFKNIVIKISNYYI